jgi:Uncharacterized protein conserved in bacteria
MAERKSSRNRRKRKPVSGCLILVLIILGLVAAGGAYWFFKGPLERAPKNDYSGDASAPVLTDKNADYRKMTRQLQDQIEESLREMGGTLERKGDEDRESDRGGGGKIRWNTRTWELVLPKDKTMESALKELTEKFHKEKKSSVSAVAMQLDRQKVTIHLLDELGGEPLRVRTAEIIISAHQKDPKKEKQARLAIVIDDFGYRSNLLADFAAYPHPLTFAILPNHPHTGAAAQAARANGKEHILHFPMEAMGNASEESMTVRVGDSQEKINKMLNDGLAQIPGAVGANNHQGSKVTSDEATIRKVMNAVKSQDIYFLDSRTISSSKAESTARSMGIPTASNQLFLDGEADVGYIKDKIRQAVENAKANGTYIVIGHDRPATLQALKEMEPIFDEMGVEVVPLSQLLH